MEHAASTLSGLPFAVRGGRLPRGPLTQGVGARQLEDSRPATRSGRSTFRQFLELSPSQTARQAVLTSPVAGRVEVTSSTVIRIALDLREDGQNAFPLPPHVLRRWILQCVMA